MYPLLAGAFRSHSLVQEFFIIRFPVFMTKGMCDVIYMNFKHYDACSWCFFFFFLQINWLHINLRICYFFVFQD